MDPDDLEAKVKGKVCHTCGDLPQVAWYEQASRSRWRIRCDCGYDKAVLVTPKYVLPTAISNMQKARRRTTMATEQRRVTVTVESLGRASGDGSRILVKAYCPELGAIKFPMPLWPPMLARPEAGKDVVVLLSKGDLMKDSAGSPKTGEYDNHYFWDVVEWPAGTEQAPQQAPAQAPGGAQEPRNGSGHTGGPGSGDYLRRVQQGHLPAVNDIDRREVEKRESIHAQKALKAAVEMVIAFPIESQKTQVNLEGAVELVVSTFDLFRDLLAAPRNPEPLEDTGDANPDAVPQEELPW